MSDDRYAPPAEVFTIPWKTIQHVLWSEEELDGIALGENGDGDTVVYAPGIWSFNLFMLKLAGAVASIVEPEREGFKQLYETLAALTMEMSMPTLDPDGDGEDIVVVLPCVRVAGTPELN